MRAHVALLLAVCGCGRVGFDPFADRDGAMGSSDATPDAIDPATPWGPPTRVSDAALASNKDDPNLSRDELTLYYELGVTLQVFTRATTSDPFGPPGDVGPAILVNDGTSRLSADELTLYFSSARTGTIGAKDPYFATRATRTDPFTNAVHFDALASPQEERWFVPCSIGGVDTGRFAFLRFTSQTNGEDLYEQDTDGVPHELAELSSPQAESGPFYADDCLTLYFASERGGGGASHLYRTHRASLSAPFDPPTQITELTFDGTDQEDPWVSPDGHRIYFRSTHENPAGEIYMATR